MKFTSILLSAFPFASWAATIPNAYGQSSTDRRSAGNGKTFSLGLVENKDFQGVDPSLEMLRAFAKFSLGLTAVLAAAVESNPALNSKYKSLLVNNGGDGGGDGEGKGVISTVAAFPPPFYDIEFVVPASIGTPPQSTYLNLDTGSADLWTFSSDTYQPQVQNQSIYRPKNSNTSQLLPGESWSIRYGDGAGAAGIVYKDILTVGDTSFAKQAIQSAVQVSFDISSDSFSSGILGMAFKGLNTVRPTKQASYFENIQDELAKPVFTSNLQKGRPGNYNFGYIDSSEYHGNIAYSPIVKGQQYQDFWAIGIDGYSVGDGDYKAYPWKGIVDTGTTLVLVPPKVVDAYYSDVEGAQVDPARGMVTFPCSAVLPDFYFGIGTYRGKVPGHYIKYGKAGYGRCYGGIQSTGQKGMAVIGDVLLKAQFVVFDAGKNRVGFANKDLIPPPVSNISPF